MSKFDLFSALESSFEEVYASDFYRDIFPIGSFEEKGVYEKGKYNGIAVAIVAGDSKAKRYTVTDDLEIIDTLVETDDFCIMSPISYAGKSRKSEFARFLYAMAIDLDGVDTLDEWNFLMTQIDKGHEMLSFVWGLPRPTYIVGSGTGLHLYFVFERPIPLFRSTVKELERLRRRITWQAWTQGASSLHDNVQYESLFQGFRMVGSITKNGERTRAFKVGEKVTVEYLNQYVPEEYRAVKFSYKSNLLLKDAKEKYPEWYQKRIVEKKPKGTWVCKKDLYYWWIRKLKAGVQQGHRYWCIMTLATYAKKCDIPFEELEKDAYGLIPFMNTKGDKFTEDDVLHALEAYNDSYITYPINTIIQRTDIPIQKNKRNYRKQEQHLQYARGIRQLKRDMGEMVAAGGRPKKKKIVKEWMMKNPNGKKIDCEKETGISRPTVLKWWNDDE
jgi:hypothetical protein